MDSKHLLPATGLFAISGLGVDGRVFDRLARMIPIRVLAWALPLEGETMSAYAARRLKELPAEGPIGLIGYSFGGIVAQEMARLRPEIRLVIVSSLCSPTERPFWMRFQVLLPFYRLVPTSLRVNLFPYFSQNFGISDPGEIRLLQAMFREADKRMRVWSFGQILFWKAGPPVPVLLRIHGDQDRVFPPRALLGDYELVSGGHFLIWQAAETIAELILKHTEGQ